MRLFNYIIILALLISCAGAGTKKRAISSTGQTADCFSMVRLFDTQGPISSGTLVALDNSYSKLIPDYEQFREKLFATRPSINKYSKRYRSEHNGTGPSVKDVLLFYRSSTEDFVQVIRSAMGNDPELDAYLQMAAANIELSNKVLGKIDTFLNDTQHAELVNSTYGQDNVESIQAIESLGHTNYKGHLGELDVLLKLDNVQAQGIYLERMEYLNTKTQKVSDILSRALDQRLASISVSDVATLKQDFPKIFKDTGGLSDSEILDKGIEFLKAKEFDIVTKKGDKYAFVEVKNYKHPVGSSDMKTHLHGKKSIFDQQLETIDTIRFLGLEGKFYPAIVLLNGITSPAKAKMEQVGISVLADVIE